MLPFGHGAWLRPAVTLRPRGFFDRPNEVMQALQDNVALHLSTGALLIGGVLVGRRWGRARRGV